jgi:hypothetical protein
MKNAVLLLAALGLMIGASVSVVDPASACNWLNQNHHP